MKKIDSMSSIEGRQALSKLFLELKYEKNISALSCLAVSWKVCTNERELAKHSSQEAIVVHPLGFFAGTALWLEEIVNRYYFSTINSFVYLGAALLLILIGIRRFSDSVSDTVVIAGVCFEALMLVFMFIVMFFSPQEDILQNGEKNLNGAGAEMQDILIEVGEIARDFASTSASFEQVNESLKEMVRQQKELISSVEKIGAAAADAVAPNPRLIELMKETNQSFEGLKSSVERLNQSTASLQKEAVEAAVRKEIEKYFVNRVGQSGQNSE
jgi:hypothetical protein